jgi:hypothetical protein
MKIIVLLFLLISTHILFGQLIENFNDGNFTSNPIWEGDTGKFKINPSYQLQLNSSGTDTSILTATNNLIINTEWEFYSKLTFNTSSNNLGRVYLTSNQKDLTGNLNGYFVQIGSTLDDICLYRQDGNQLTSLICSPSPITSTTSNELKIKVLRQASGVWELKASLAGSILYQTYGTIIDTTYKTSDYFGIFCKYTTSNSQRFYFDDIKIQQIQVDSFAPILKKIVVVTKNKIDLYFDEPIDSASGTKTSNYLVNNNIGIPLSAEVDNSDPSIIHLSMANNFVLGTNYILTIDNLKDLLGNQMSQKQENFTYYVAQAGDITINEIMADPNPTIGLPDAEYLELYNHSLFPISLKNWQLTIGTKTNLLPDTMIKSKEYIIVSHQDFSSIFSSYGKTIGLTSLSLVNSGQMLIIQNSEGALINKVNYSNSWYGQTSKADGGWSLEQIDPSNSCGGSENWWSSNDGSGGTPGKKNSIFASKPDIAAPQIGRVAVVDSITINVNFTESIDSIRLFNLSAYKIHDSIGNPVSVTANFPLYNFVQLKLAKTLKNEIIYKLQITDTLSDCAGNQINIGTTVPFGIAENSEKNDLVINEILFDPKDNGVDYIEIYNRSSKIIELKGLKLANYDYSMLDFTNISEITEEVLAIFPGQYYVLTTSPEIVRRQYFCKNPNNFVSMLAFPTLSSSSGNIYLITASQKVMDSLEYTDEMQFKMLKSFDGVSLERISFDVFNLEGNWHSASETSGFGTPTYINSQYSTSGQSTGELVITPEIFSPDNDGIDDILGINYAFSTGTVINKMIVYDAAGREIKMLADNLMPGSNGVIFWDGIDKNGTKSPIGIYLIYAETSNLNGQTHHFKKVFTLGGKL